jgi:co-chaperonin GroES (HSP10)
MYPISPRNKLVVCFDKKYQDEIVTPSGITFYKDTTFSPEWNVTVTGKVISVPQKLTIQGMTNEVQVGDELAFSYWVIEDRVPRPQDDDTFSENTETASHNKLFSNRLKEELKVTYLTKREAVGIYTNKNNDLIGGCQGTPQTVEGWLVKNFKFSRPDDMVFANLIWHEDTEFWLVDYQEALAVKRDGNIIMLGGNVLMETQEEHFTYEMNHDMHLHLVAKTEYGASKVISIGKNLSNSPDLGIVAGDTVRFNQSYVQKYELWGKNYLLIPQSRILGRI